MSVQQSSMLSKQRINFYGDFAYPVHLTRRSTSMTDLAQDTLTLSYSESEFVEPLPSPSSLNPVNPRRRHQIRRGWFRCLPSYLHRVRWAVIIIFLAFAGNLWLLLHTARRQSDLSETLKHTLDQIVLQPSCTVSSLGWKSPERWLREHSVSHFRDSQAAQRPQNSLVRPRAALISLVRNEELDGMLQSMRQLEYRWNSRYRYPWIFFNEKPFTEEFKAATSNATTAPTSYHTIPRAHWSVPTHIDREGYKSSLSYLGSTTVGKGHLPSYRHMCRWNSGFFYLHPALSSFEYYWRVEPDVHFFCDISYDPFRFMQANDLIYGFNMNILDDARSFASLWARTREFVEAHPHLLDPSADINWLTDLDAAGEYNNCQFFSNFEIGALDFFRAEPNLKFFDYLDRSGGFFYERYGDAPIHTISVALFAPKDRVWFFRDIGYQHDIARHCPRDGVESGRCDCEPTSLDENFYKLVPMESPQRKPADSCIRLWLGGEWLEKKEGWDQEAERLVGGDGYGGYVRDLL